MVCADAPLLAGLGVVLTMLGVRSWGGGVRRGLGDVASCGLTRATGATGDWRGRDVGGRERKGETWLRGRYL